MIVINKSLGAKNARLKIDQLLLLEINRIQQAPHNHSAVSRIVWTLHCEPVELGIATMFCSQQLPSAPGASLYFVSPLSPVLCTLPQPLPGSVWRAARAAPVRAQSSFSDQAVNAGSSTALLTAHSLSCVDSLSVGRHTAPPSPLNIGSQGSNQTYPARSYYAITGEHRICCGIF